MSRGDREDFTFTLGIQVLLIFQRPEIRALDHFQMKVEDSTLAQCTRSLFRNLNRNGGHRIR